jgi:hypothetical protein
MIMMTRCRRRSSSESGVTVRGIRVISDPDQDPSHRVMIRLGHHDQRNPQDVITCNYMHYMDITCHYMQALYMIVHVIT